MANVTFSDVKKAHEAAGRLGFRKTELMLEGLRDRLVAMGECRAGADSAQHVLAGIDCIRHVMKAEEMMPDNRSEFRWRNMNRALGRVLAAGTLGTAALIGVAELGHIYGAGRLAGVAIVAIAGAALWESVRGVAEMFTGSRGRLIFSVRATLTRLEADVREYAASEKKQSRQAPQTAGQG